MKKYLISSLILFCIMFLPNNVTAFEVNSEISNFNPEEQNTSDYTNDYTGLEGICNVKKINTSDGGYIILASNSLNDNLYINGVLVPSNGAFDYFIFKYDSEKNLEWWNQFGGSEYELMSSEDHLQEVENGYIFIATSSSTDIEGIENKGNADLVFVKYDKNGNLLWQKNWGGSAYEYIKNISLADQNNLIIIVQSNSNDIENVSGGLVILHLDTDGNIKIDSSWGGTEAENFTEIESSENEHIFYTSSKSTDIDGFTNKGESDLYILKYDQNWKLVKQVHWGGNGKDYAYRMDKVRDGYIVIGETSSTNIDGLINQGQEDAFIIKFDNELNMEWQGSYGNNYAEYFNNLYEFDDSYIVIGSRKHNTYYSDAIIAKYDKKGNLKASAKYGGNNSDSFNNVVETSTGYIVSGTTYSTDIEGITNHGGNDLIVLRYDKELNLLWHHNYGGDDSESLEDIAINKFEKSILILMWSYSENIEGVDNYESYARILVQYDMDGNLISQQVVSYANDINTLLTKTVKTPDNGNIEIFTYYDKSPNSDLLITKYDANNKELWQIKYGGSGKEEIIKAIPTSDGGVFIELGTDSTDIEGIVSKANKETILVKLDKNGKIAYQQNGLYGSYFNTGIKEYTYNSTLDGGFVIAHNVVDINPNGTNLAEIVKGADMYIYKYDAKGNLEWHYDYEDEAIELVDVIKELENGTYQVITVKVTSLENMEYDYAKIELTVDYELTQEKTDKGTYSVKQEGNKGVITLNPDKGYTLDKITITNSKGEELEYYEENGNYYFLLYDDVKVNVTYKEDISNPNTITFLKLGFIAVIIFAIYNLFIAKKLKVKRFA